MQFEMDNSPGAAVGDRLLNGGYRRVYASGELTTGTTARFLEFVKRNQLQHGQVIFNSPGGSLGEGLRLGRTIRELGFSTSIGTQMEAGPVPLCASACAYAFLGGVSRYYRESDGLLGVHQFYSPEGLQSADEVQQISGQIVQYMDEMGVRATAFSLASMANRDGMIWLSEQDALQLRFANNGTLPTSAELKLIDFRPYLRLNQQHRDSAARILLICDAGDIQVLFGIVTSVRAVEEASSHTNYLEFDHHVFEPQPYFEGLTAAGDTMWINRTLRPSDIARFMAADTVGGWLDGNTFRWGAEIDLIDVRPAIADYIGQCRSNAAVGR